MKLRNKSNYEQTHDKIWTFALSKAREVYPENIKTVNGFSKDASETPRYIMAMVFYKKCFDSVIHG